LTGLTRKGSWAGSIPHSAASSSKRQDLNVEASMVRRDDGLEISKGTLEDRFAEYVDVRAGRLGGRKLISLVVEKCSTTFALGVPFDVGLDGPAELIDVPLDVGLDGSAELLDVPFDVGLEESANSLNVSFEEGLTGSADFLITALDNGLDGSAEPRREPLDDGLEPFAES
jgi:hypothetical protein